MVVIWWFVLASTHACIVHADVLEGAQELRTEVLSRLRCVGLFVREFIPVMGTHAGPGLLGWAFYTGHDRYERGE